MPGKNIFDKPFDDGTKAKLEIFKQYFEEWLPVFVSGNKIYWQRVQVFDFFAGMGKDASGHKGSPLIILDTANNLGGRTKANNVKLRLVFNEKDPDNHEELNNNIERHPKYNSYTTEVYNKPFAELFEECYPSMINAANFLFLDQNGIKEITSDIFRKIISLKRTDFLFFISSSYFKRFAETPEFRRYFPEIDSSMIEGNYFHVHRKVLNHYKSLIPSDKEYFLAPFSIRKGSNIYGLIFGTNHTLGMEKFLTVAWKIDKLRGEANYDIDGERINNSAPSLFEQFNLPQKRQMFEEGLRQNILKSIIRTDRDAYLYTLSEGFLLKDSHPTLKKLKAEGKINYEFDLVSSDIHKIKVGSAITIL